jgi:threonine aldolase
MATAGSKSISWLFTAIVLFLLSNISPVHGSAKTQSNASSLGQTVGRKGDAKSNADLDTSQSEHHYRMAQFTPLDDYARKKAAPVSFRNVNTTEKSGIVRSESGEGVFDRGAMILLGIGLIVGAQFGKRKFLRH